MPMWFLGLVRPDLTGVVEGETADLTDNRLHQHIVIRICSNYQYLSESSVFVPFPCVQC